MKKEAASSIARLDRGVMKRVLGVKDLFAVGYGDLGSSIYYALGVTVFYALGAAPISLALAGLVFICTALTYAEMTATFHESGGSASLARHAFNDLVSFIAGWGLLLDYIVTIAISAFAVGPYLSVFFSVLKTPFLSMGFSIGLIALLYLINVIGVKQSTRMSYILVGTTLLTQLLIIGVGVFTILDLPLVIDHMRINIRGALWSPDWSDFWKGTAMAMVAYTGIESIAQLGAEAKKPEKTCPRAIFWTMGTLVFMYLGISVIALSALSPHVLSTQYLEDPIAGIVSVFPFGNVLSLWVGLLAACLLFVAANAGLIGASRLAFNMGEYYQLPRIFYRLHSKRRTPYVSLLFFACIAALVILWSRGKMEFLADLYNFGAMIAFFFAHLSLIVMRIKKPDLKRPFRVPFNLRISGYDIPITAIIGCLATFSVWVLIVLTKPDGRYLGCAWMIVGVTMYVLYRRKEKISATGQIAIEKIKVPEFKTLSVKNILVPTRGGAETETIQMACELARLHNARVTAIHIIEIPSSLPLDIEVPHRMIVAGAILKRAEAIARECHVAIDLEIIRSRSVAESVLEILSLKKYDLLVLGAMAAVHDKHHKMFGSITEKILKESPCRVWLCCSELSEREVLNDHLTVNIHGADS
jgi:basic amino acid/polyamine antiporter, APA family